jgi:hypothetical protein
VNPQGSSAESVHARAGPASAGPGERARLSAAAGSLLDRRGDVCRREEPPRYESGLRAHGSNQRFHRLLGHAVARALTTAPSLTDLSPAAQGFSSLKGGGARGRPARCRTNKSRCRPVTIARLGRSEPTSRKAVSPQSTPSLDSIDLRRERAVVTSTQRNAGCGGLRDSVPCRPAGHL